MNVIKKENIKMESVGAGKGVSRQVLIGQDMGPNFAMRRFEIQPGGGMPLHTNAVEHQQIVLGGRGRVVLGDEVHEVEKNDILYIPAGLKHSYQSIGDEPFVFICTVPNSPDKIEICE